MSAKIDFLFKMGFTLALLSAVGMVVTLLLEACLGRGSLAVNISGYACLTSLGIGMSLLVVAMIVLLWRE